MTTVPKGLGSGGKSLWLGITTAEASLTAAELAILEQACRQRDRADSLADRAATGDASALRHEREASLAMARLITALRLPDVNGRRPQLRALRGTYQPDKASSLDRAREISQRRITGCT